MKKKVFKEEKGFTLVEVLVVMSLFTFIVTISLGAITQVFDVNRRAQSMSFIMDNLSNNLEIITTQIRFGEEYSCESEGSNGCDGIKFINYNEEEMVYFLEDGIIKAKIGGENPYRISSPEVHIGNLQFYIEDSLVTVVIKGEVGSSSGRSEFHLQTSTSKRSTVTSI